MMDLAISSCVSRARTSKVAVVEIRLTIKGVKPLALLARLEHPLLALFNILARVLDVIVPEDVQIRRFIFRQWPLHTRGRSHHERARRNLCARHKKRACGHERFSPY